MKFITLDFELDIKDEGISTLVSLSVKYLALNGIANNSLITQLHSLDASQGAVEAGIAQL